MNMQMTINRFNSALAALLARNTRRVAWLAGVVVLFASGTAMANTYYWNQTGSTTYGTSADWSNNSSSGGTTGTVPGAADTGVFNQSTKNGTTQSKIGSAKSVNGVQFVNTGTTLISANTSSPQTWTIGSGGITISSTAGAVTISQSGLPIAVSLSGSQSWTNSSSNTMTDGSGVLTGVSAAAGGATLTLNGKFTFLAPVNNGAGTLTLAQSGGTVTLSSGNTYSGSTSINGGTLVLGSSGSINNTPGISIAASGTFDVSAQSSPYAVPGSTFSASGNGTTAGSSEAQIIGPSSGAVDLGSQGITLTWGGATSGTDTTHPCLVVSQGALALNSNVFTINGSTLGVGTYRLIQVGDGFTGTITGSLNSSPLGTAIDGTKINTVSTDGDGNVLLTVSSASSPTINATALTGSLSTTYGTASATPGSFSVSGLSLTPDTDHLTVTAPSGFEVSLSSGSGYTTSLSVPYSGGVLTSTPVYVRLAATTSAGTYSDNIQIDGGSASTVYVAISSSTVSALAVQLSGSKTYDGSTTILAADLSIANKVGSDDVTLSGSATLAAANAGPQSISSVSGLSLGGSTAGNYTLTGYSGSATVSPAASSVTAWPTAGALRLGLTLASAALTGGSGTPSPGTFTWTSQATAPVALGSQSESVTYTPNDTNYGPMIGTASVLVQGGDGTWILDGDGNWSVGGNWQSNWVADGAGTTGTFTPDLSHNSTVMIDSTSRTLGTMNVGSVSGRSLTFDANNGAKLIFDNGSGAAQLTYISGAGNNTYFYGPILLNSSLNITNSNSRVLYFANAASVTNNSSGAVTITNNGGGNGGVNFGVAISNGTSGGTVSLAQSSATSALTLGATNTYSGGTTVSAGTLNFSGFPAQPSSGTLAISGGAIVNLSSLGAATATTPTVSVTGAGTLNMNIGGTYTNLNTCDYDMSGFTGVLDISGAGGRLLMQSPFVSPAAGAKIIVENGTTAYLGYIGTTTLVCTVQLNGTTDDGENLGQLRVENNAQQNGPVILNANSTIGSAGGTGYIGGVISDGGLGHGFTKVGSGTVTLTRANTYTGATTVSQGTLALVGGSQASPITVSSGASLEFTLGSPTTSTNSFNLSAGTIKITGTPTLASYPLITSSTGITGTPTLDAVIPGYALQVSGGTTLNLVQTGGGFSSWITGLFANGTVPAGLQGPNDDPTNDGISNLLKYAIAGQDPTVGNPTISTFSANTLSFTKRAGTSGLTYAIVQSSDLGVTDPWTEVPAGPSYTNNATTISYTFTPGSPVRNFIRLQVLSN